jgi:hypothetical protein
MAFKSIHDQNPFIVPAILLAAMLLLRWYLASRPGPYRPWAQQFGRKSIAGVASLLVACLLLIPTFETYFRVMQCRVSEKYMRENLDMAHRAMDVFLENRIPYWLDYATLLNELRGQDLNQWEQDVDFSTIMPTHLQAMRNLPVLPGDQTLAEYIDQAKLEPDGPFPALTVEALMKKFAKAGFDVVYVEKGDRSVK